jgi:hypothetical protein
VDLERFIDIKGMLQKRYDDPYKVRNVKRETASKAPVSPKQPPFSPKQPPFIPNK